MPSLAQSARPHLRQTKTSSQLIVNGEPFLMLPGELHNSSLSSAEYMAEVYPLMKSYNFNTLLGSVTWEMIEPEEGLFDFNELDKVILGARQHNMKLVLLWFGTYKNAMSTYVPGWVKNDFKRFPRARILDNGELKTIEYISPFNNFAWEADARAFAALMRHLREFDEQHSTVIMVQVENETGILGDSRDRSRLAEEAFKQPVPSKLMQYLQKKEILHPKFNDKFPNLQQTQFSADATWDEVFGSETQAEEMFMANAISQFCEKVAAAGKAEYPLPFYANVWLNFDDPSVLELKGVPIPEDGAALVAGGGVKPGLYPSGGPCPHLIDIWKFNAPLIDFLGPDLYLHNYEWVCQQYRYENQPLFIPEQKRDLPGARRAWLAYGSYGALGCSPFGIDTLTSTESALWKRSYGLLQSISHLILDAQANNPKNIMGFFFDEFDKDDHSEKPWIKEFSEYVVKIERSFVFGKPGPGYGVVIHYPPDRFLLIGCGFQVTISSKNPRATFTGILYCEEKYFDDSEVDADKVNAVNGSSFSKSKPKSNSKPQLKTLRVMNGDETRSGAFMMMPTEDPDYGGFPIAVTIPARTYIAELTAYSIFEDE